MSREGSDAVDPATGVPAALLDFDRTLRTGGVTALELLGGYDAYTNQPGPVPAEVLRGVPVREVAGWRVTADVYVPHGEPPHPTVLWLHGGAWVMGAPATHRRLAEDLCALGLLTFVLDYRRAPKHRFPAGLDDARAALAWVADQAGGYGGDATRLFIGGDSAGGNLAAAVLATGVGPDVRGAILAYGIYDVHRALPALVDLVGGPDPDSQLYLEPDDARALVNDPRLHPDRYCAGFPRALVLSGAEDPLHAESEALVSSLTAAEVPHTFVVADAPHGFLQLPTHPGHAVGLRAIEQFVTAA